MDKVQEMEIIWLSDDLYINFSTSEIIQDDTVVGCINGKKVYRMLYYFCVNMERILSKNQIIEYVWNEDADDNTTDANFNGYVYKIRKLHPILNELLETKVGIGYVMHKKKCRIKHKDSINKLNHVEYAQFFSDKQKEIISRINNNRDFLAFSNEEDYNFSTDFNSLDQFFDYYQDKVYKYLDMREKLIMKIQLLEGKKDTDDINCEKIIDEIIHNYRYIIDFISNKIDELNDDIRRIREYNTNAPSNKMILCRVQIDLNQIKSICLLNDYIDNIYQELDLLENII